PEEIISTIKSAAPEIKRLVLEDAKALAEERCTNMERLIMTQQHEGGWDEAYKACVDDFSKYLACVMKGPLPKRIDSMKWDDEKAKYVPIKKIVPGYWRISPFNAYPAPNALRPDDGPFIELEPFQ